MAWRELPKNFGQPRREALDANDLAAESLGNAMKTEKDHGPAILGRRISKNTRQLDGRRKTADARAIKNLVKDTAAALTVHAFNG